MTQSASAPRLVTIANAADQLGVSLRTVYELMSRGELASVKFPVGRARRIEQAEIDRFIKANRTATATP